LLLSTRKCRENRIKVINSAFIRFALSGCEAEGVMVSVAQVRMNVALWAKLRVCHSRVGGNPGSGGLYKFAVDDKDNWRVRDEEK
jgi:hypothetical protein